MAGGSRQRAAGERAVDELYHACYRRLVTQLYAFTADRTEAQDVVQEAFARALARPGALADVDNPEAWLRTVAVNVVRRRWRRRRVFDVIMLRERPIRPLVEPGPEPDRTDLSAALAAIPRHYREAIVLHYFADLSVDEIAETLGVPSGTIKSRLSRGRSALAEHLHGYAPGTTGEADRTANGSANGGAHSRPAPAPEVSHA